MSILTIDPLSARCPRFDSRIFWLWGVIGFMAMANSFAQDSASDTLTSSISASRPGFNTPPTTLEAGHWQWEAGYQYTSNDDDGVDSDDHTLPLLLLRLGLSDRFEANLFWAGHSDFESSAGDADGVNDLGLGITYQITEDDAPLAMGVFAVLSLPVGSDDLSSDEVDPALGFAWSYAGDSGPGWFGTIVVNSVTEGNERATVLSASIGAAFSITERLGSYVEYFGNHSDSADSANSINGGFTYLLSNDIQLDINGGGGLDHAADDYFVGAGVAWRF